MFSVCSGVIYLQLSGRGQPVPGESRGRGRGQRVHVVHLPVLHGGVAGGDSAPASVISPTRGGHTCPPRVTWRGPLQPGQARPPVVGVAGDDVGRVERVVHPAHLRPPAALL